MNWIEMQLSDVVWVVVEGAVHRGVVVQISPGHHVYPPPAVWQVSVRLTRNSAVITRPSTQVFNHERAAVRFVEIERGLKQLAEARVEVLAAARLLRAQPESYEARLEVIEADAKLDAVEKRVLTTLGSLPAIVGELS